MTLYPYRLNGFKPLHFIGYGGALPCIAETGFIPADNISTAYHVVSRRTNRPMRPLGSWCAVATQQEGDLWRFYPQQNKSDDAIIDVAGRFTLQVELMHGRCQWHVAVMPKTVMMQLALTQMRHLYWADNVLGALESNQKSTLIKAWVAAPASLGDEVAYTVEPRRPLMTVVQMPMALPEQPALGCANRA